MNNISILLVLLSGLLALTIDLSYAESDTVQFSIKFFNGDRVSLGNIDLVIYQKNQDTPFATINGSHQLQYLEADLPPGYKYKIEIYSNQMLSSTSYLQIDKPVSDVIDLTIPTSGGLKINVLYDDLIPIQDVKVLLKTHSGEQIREVFTDYEGNTPRMWVASTHRPGDYYVAEIIIDEKITYEHSEISLQSGSTDLKITAPWASVIPTSVVIDLYNKESKKFSSHDDQFSVKLIDKKGNEKVSKIIRGTANFPEMAVGIYRLMITQDTENSGIEGRQVWADEEVILNGKDNQIQVIVESPQTFEGVIIDEPPDLQPVEYALQDSSYAIISDFQQNHVWKKQSQGGTQEDSVNDFVLGSQSLALRTEGDGLSTFTRSTVFEPAIDISDKKVGAKIKIDDAAKVKEIWFIFTSDKFANGWLTYKVDFDLLNNHNGEWFDVLFDPLDSEFTGNPNLSSINQIQIRIADNKSGPIQLNINELYLVTDQNKDVDNQSLSCNCVAFRFDDVQDFWLDEVQIDVLDVFYKNKIPLTLGVVGDNFGDDKKLLNFVSHVIVDNPNIEIANHGYQHEDFATFQKAQQSDLLKKSNQAILETLRVTPVTFIPPLNSFNKDTLYAMRENGFKYFSTDLDESNDVYQMSDSSLYHFPEGATTGELNKEIMLFEGLTHQETFSDIQNSIKNYGFAVVTMHPQEFSTIRDGVYSNTINPTQIDELKSLITTIDENNIDMVLISQINENSSSISSIQTIPQWIKNNAGLWADKQITDTDFSKGLEYLIKINIIKIPYTIPVGADVSETHIPEWIRVNANWWSEGLLSDEEFTKSIQYMITQRIIKI